jgi:hypothetical protein
MNTSILPNTSHCAKSDRLLAGSLNNLANRLSALGRLEEALATATEAAGLHRDLARAQPDSFTPISSGHSATSLPLLVSSAGPRKRSPRHKSRQI